MELGLGFVSLPSVGIGMVSALVLVWFANSWRHRAGRSSARGWAMRSGRRFQTSLAARMWETVPEPLALFDEEGRLAFTNRLFKDVFGNLPEDEVGKLAMRVGHALSGEAISFMDEDLSIRKASGETGHFRIQCVPLIAESGMKQCLAVLQDRAREDALRERLASIVQSSQIAILSLNPEGKVETWNPGALLMYGYTSEEMVGQSVFHLVPLGRGAELQGALKECRAGRAVPYFETVHIKKESSSFPVCLMLAPILDAGGLVSSISWISHDMTEVERSRDYLRKLSRVVEQTDDMVMITDISGRIEYVNPAFERYTEYTKEEALGKTPRLLKSGAQKPAVYHSLWETILRGESFRSAFINRRKGGALLYTQKTITPLKDEKGNLTHFVSTDKDVTAQRQLEEGLVHAQRRFQNIFYSSRDAIAYCREDGTIVEANDAFLHLTGFAADEVIGKRKIQESTIPEFAADEDKALRRLLDSGQPTEYRKLCLAKDGSIIHVVVNTFRVREPTDGFDGYVATLKLISRSRDEQSTPPFEKRPIGLRRIE